MFDAKLFGTLTHVQDIRLLHLAWKLNVILNCHILILMHSDSWHKAPQYCCRFREGFKDEPTLAGQKFLGFFPDVWRFPGKLLFFLPVSLSLKRTYHAGSDHRTRNVVLASLWHTGVFSFKPRASCYYWSRLLSVFVLSRHIGARMCTSVIYYKSLRASANVKPFRITDKCQSLCLASVCLCTSGLGLQAVVRD